jgi:hypothetical protein
MVESYSSEPYLRLNGKLTLGHIDYALKEQSGGQENASEIVSACAVGAEGFQKRLEQVGSAYEKLKVRVHKLAERAALKQKQAANGLHHHVDDSSSESEEETKDSSPDTKDGDFNQDWEKKRKRRTKEDIEKEALLMGDLYAILGLDHLTYEAGEGDIKSAYKKLALMYHPDKIGESITQSDKEVWLQV